MIKNISLSMPIPSVILVKFPSQYLLTASFMRFQEFYESPFKNIRGKVFSIEKYMDTYASKSSGKNFTYNTDWNGFNIPGDVFIKCVSEFDAAGEKFNIKEQSLISNVFGFALKHNLEKYYLIGVHTENGETTIDAKDHEIAHSLFCLIPSYKKEMLDLVKSLPDQLTKKMTDVLLDMGYDKKVVKDEIQAYLSTSDNTFLNETFGIRSKKDLKIAEKFSKVFDKYKTYDGN